MEFNTFLIGVGIVLAICFGSILLCALLGAVGFTAAGVAAGSCAAAWQSCIGNVARGTCFALLQSLAATRLLANCACLSFIVIIGTTLVLYAYISDYDFGNIMHDANVTTTNLMHNISTMASHINISKSDFTEPINKMKMFFDGICKNCTNIFG